MPLNQTTETLTVEERAKAARSPLGFAQVTKPGWIYNPHQQIINKALERVFIGRCPRLIINVPPRSGKTELAVKNFIAWATGHFPDSEWIHASYSKRLAARNTYEARSIMQSVEYQQIFPHVTMQQDSKAKDEFRTGQGGIVYATGAEGTITGYGAGKKRDGFGGCVVIDDPHNATETNSDTMRKNVLDWYMTTMQSRLNTPDTPVIVIMQRLHEDDLTGFLLNGGSGEEWEHICIPAIDEHGESYWEEQLPLARLQQMKIASPMVFSGQYMQSPAPAEGAIFKLPWFQRYNHAPDQCDMIVHSWDTAYKPKEHNDPSALTVWRVTPSGYYLVDCVTGRWEYPELKRNVVNYAQRDNPHAILVEDKASGQSLLQDLNYEGNLPLISIEPIHDKETRARACAGQVEGKNVFLPIKSEWLADFEHEVTLFPNGKHDDRVDSMSQFLNWLRNKDSAHESRRKFMDFYR